VKDISASLTTLTMPLPDGEHWFHLRAVDAQGNWGQAVHVGPIRIDTFRPVRPVPSSPSHQVGGASADRTIDVAWSGASDAQSGLDGFAVSWTQGMAGSPPTVKNVEETVSRVTSPQLAVGAWWFNIRAVDNAGNWSDAVSVGPFSIRVGPAACTVPRLRGLSLVAAKRLLAKRGCSLGRVSRVRSRRVARGRVVAQRPAPGIRLARGARVRVVLSRGRR
jgi:chitodextrinase